MAFHGIGWVILERYVLYPTPLVKEGAHYVDTIKRVIRDSKMGLVINLCLTVLAWWFPLIALTINALIWMYWLYLAVSMKQKDI